MTALGNSCTPERLVVDIEGALTTLWEPSHQTIQQVGFVEDDTRRIEFTAWKRSRVPMVEEGRRVRFRRIARNGYRGRVLWR